MAATRNALVGLACFGLLAWMALAILFFPAGPAWLRTGLAATVPLAALVGVRPLRRVVVGVLGAFLVVLCAWLAMPPSHERDWQPAYAPPSPRA